LQETLAHNGEINGWEAVVDRIRVKRMIYLCFPNLSMGSIYYSACYYRKKPNMLKYEELKVKAKF
jgi:hypothetical protein